MARRSKEELIVELHRLYDVFETLYACMEPLYGPEAFEMLTRSTITRERMLDLLADGTVTASELIEGARQGLNDQLESIEDALEDQPDIAKLVLASYKRQSGRDLYDDAGNPCKAAKIIVKRGKIESDIEFYLLKGVMSNVDQSVFKEPQTTKAYAMLDDYDRSQP